MEEIYQKVGKFYPFNESTFKTLCNKFIVHSSRSIVFVCQCFDLEHFLLGTPTKRNPKETKVEIPIIEGLKGYSLQKVWSAGDTVTQDKKTHVKEAGILTNAKKALLLKELENDFNIEKFNEKYENVPQEMALTKMEIYKNVIYEYTFKECLTQGQYNLIG